MNCSPEREFVYINPSTAHIETLAHEVGHALGLHPDDRGGHSNICIDSSGFPCLRFGRDNLMMWLKGVFIRDNITIGQSFRMNWH